MSVNKYLPHIHELPEDDANRQLANGFRLYRDLNDRQIHVLEEAGGWNVALDRFSAIYAAEMDRFPTRFMVLLIDFDGRTDRLKLAKSRIPDHLKDRVFILGTLTEPEDLKAELGSYETIGLLMAQDCHEGTGAIWSHRLLSHNTDEIDRLRNQVCRILFSAD